MNEASASPKGSIEKLKRTKIIATLGPSTNSYEHVIKMLEAGVNGFRLNFSHGAYEDHAQFIHWVRKASTEVGKPVSIIQDLQGPKLRLGDFDDIFPVQKNKEFVLEFNANYRETGALPMLYDLSKKVKPGERILLSDGRIKTVVTNVRQGLVYLKAMNEGILVRRKGINLPDTDLGGDILTPKDKKDIAFGSEQEIDYVALSFVQHADDIKKLKRILHNHNSNSKVIAKIETKAATENIDEIIDESDAIMIARGDLALETLTESVPIIQRSIIGKCLEKGKISIVATQMLASMTKELEPTRAEVSDVATAVIVGADCVMLSDETASGDWPIQSIEMMRRIIFYTQENTPLKPVFFNSQSPSLSNAVSSAILDLTHRVEAKAIVAITRTGSSARAIAAQRPNVPIIIVTSDLSVARKLAIVYGGFIYLREETEKAAFKLTEWLYQKQVFKKDDIIVVASNQYPDKFIGMDTIKVRKF